MILIMFILPLQVETFRGKSSRYKSTSTFEAEPCMRE